eukprot:6468311-Amphidinium_carterae.6
MKQPREPLCTSVTKMGALVISQHFFYSDEVGNKEIRYDGAAVGLVSHAMLPTASTRSSSNSRSAGAVAAFHIACRNKDIKCSLSCLTVSLKSHKIPQETPLPLLQQIP